MLCFLVEKEQTYLPALSAGFMMEFTFSISSVFILINLLGMLQSLNKVVWTDIAGIISFKGKYSMFISYYCNYLLNF